MQQVTYMYIHVGFNCESLIRNLSVDKSLHGHHNFILYKHLLDFQIAKNGTVDAELSHLYLNASRRSRDAIAAEFNLPTPLYFSYTHLVCRTAKEGADCHICVYYIYMYCQY